MQAELIPRLPDDVALQCLLRLPIHAIPVARGVCRLWKNELTSSSFNRLREAAGLKRPVVALLLRSKLLPLDGKFHLAFFEPATGAWTMRRLTANYLVIFGDISPHFHPSFRKVTYSYLYVSASFLSLYWYLISHRQKKKEKGRRIRFQKKKKNQPLPSYFLSILI